MAKELYKTEGLILSHRPKGEDSVYLLILTVELGLVRAVAQGLRLGKSKLHGHLQVGYRVMLDLVRGRDFWRVVGAQSASKVLPSSVFGREAFSRVIQLIIRLLPHDEPNVQIYNDLLQAAHLLDNTDLKSTEALIVMRLLNNLGYFDPAPTFTQFADNPEISPALVDQFTPQCREAIKLINQSLAASHL